MAATFEEFKAGLHKVCDKDILAFFQPCELMDLVAGHDNYDWNIFELVNSDLVCYVALAVAMIKVIPVSCHLNTLYTILANIWLLFLHCYYFLSGIIILLYVLI